MKTIYYAIQNIIRGKDSTLVKVVSLSLGLFLSIVLFARVAMELSYDTFYQGHQQLHFVQTAWDFGKGGKPDIGNCLYPTGPTIMQHFPEQVESATVINSWWPIEFKHGERIYDGDEFLAADSLFFQTMGIPLLEGNAKDLGCRMWYSCPNPLRKKYSEARTRRERPFFGTERMKLSSKASMQIYPKTIHSEERQYSPWQAWTSARTGIAEEAFRVSSD